MPNVKVDQGGGVSREALSDPHFIIQKGGDLYVTLAVVKYGAGATGSQATGVAEMRRKFREGLESHNTALVACEVSGTSIIKGMQTDPKV